MFNKIANYVMLVNPIVRVGIGLILGSVLGTSIAILLFK